MGHILGLLAESLHLFYIKDCNGAVATYFNRFNLMGMVMHRSIVTFFMMLLLVMGLSACGVTSVYSDHYLIEENDKAFFANVYFIRQHTERTMGMADNTVLVELDQRPLLDLGKGEYTLMHLKPSEVWVTLKNESIVGVKLKIKEMVKTRQFEFKGGHDYFVNIYPVDGELRGLYFLPELIDKYEAADVSQHLRAVGLARKFPISSLIQ